MHNNECIICIIFSCEYRYFDLRLALMEKEIMIMTMMMMMMMIITTAIYTDNRNYGNLIPHEEHPMC